MLTQVCLALYALLPSQALQYQQAISVYSVTVVICLVILAGVTSTQGSTNCGILQSRIGEHSESLENTLFVIQNIIFMTQNSFLQHLLRQLENHNIRVWITSSEM